MKHIVLKTTLGLFGLLLLSPGARAQVTTFDVTNPNASEGAWQVVVTETGDAFSVNVSATATGAAAHPASDADEVTVTILDKANNVMTAVNNGGGTVGFGPGPWTNEPNGNTMDWKWFDTLFPPVFALDDMGRNSFVGNLTVAPTPGEQTGFIDVTVYDSVNGPWTETEQLTPEASSLALLLPGLIPLGISLRRRRNTRV
jgi:hypothetical protein